MKPRFERLLASLQELPPEQVPLLVSLGLVLGTFPVAGVPTFLCLFAALRLRLNVPALQALNSLSSPLQLALLLPLARTGAWICRAAAPVTMPAAKSLALAAVHAVAGWACICIPLGVLLYFALVLLMRGRSVLLPAFR